MKRIALRFSPISGHRSRCYADRDVRRVTLVGPPDGCNRASSACVYCIRIASLSLSHDVVRVRCCKHPIIYCRSGRAVNEMDVTATVVARAAMSFKRDERNVPRPSLWQSLSSRSSREHNTARVSLSRGARESHVGLEKTCEIIGP